MIVNSYKITEARQLTPLSPDEVVETSRMPGARVWLDLLSPERDQLEKWLDDLGTSYIAKLLLLDSGDRPGFYPLESEIVSVLPVVIEKEGARDVSYFAFLCTGSLLLTAHREPLFSPQDLDMLDHADAWLAERSIAGVVSAMMIDLSQDSFQQAADIRDAVIALDERMDRDPEAVEAEEIQDIRDEVLKLGAAVSDQIPPFRALGAIDKPFFKLEDSRDFMTCALANLQAASGTLSWLDRQVSALRASFQMHAQEKTNRRLGMLTILSAVFMPITLLAGIWGMNFEVMPELKLTFGYPMALGTMLVVGLGMLLYFRKGGWLD
jgi:Mg2+ and Co2+ transporter CorA